jgi:hypothetical protein
MTKKELKARIAELEAKVNALEIEVWLEREKSRITPMPLPGISPYAPYITWSSNRTVSDPPPNAPVHHGWPSQPGVAA